MQNVPYPAQMGRELKERIPISTTLVLPPTPNIPLWMKELYR